MKTLALAAVLLGIVQVDSRTAADHELKVTLLGTGTPMVRSNRFGPSVLLEAGGVPLLFDAGRGVVVRLKQAGASLATIDTVFLTHMHSDHITGLADLWLTGSIGAPVGGRNGPLEVIGPVGVFEHTRDLDQAYRMDTEIRIHDGAVTENGRSFLVTEFIDDTIVYDRHGIVVTAFSVPHGLIYPAYGFLIDYQGHTVVISGDTRFDESLGAFCVGADLFIHEVAAFSEEALLRLSPRTGGPHRRHTTAQEAGMILAKARPKLAVFTHIIRYGAEGHKPSLNTILTQAQHAYLGPLWIGEDLMSIHIADTPTVHR